MLNKCDGVGATRQKVRRGAGRSCRAESQLSSVSARYILLVDDWTVCMAVRLHTGHVTTALC